MNIKVQCACQTKFSFDVEPVDGKMPVTIFCPKCGADATELANYAIQQTSGAQAPAAPAAPQGRIRLQVAHQPAAATHASSGSEGGVAASGIEMCNRHPRNAAQEHCVVCQKAICPECMQTFGFLCSINCRYRADQEGIKVPVYKLQKNLVERGETNKALAITAAVALVLLALAGGWFWYISVGLKPRPFYSLKLPADKKGVYAKFLGPNQILVLKQDQISLHDIKTKEDKWTTALEDPKPEPEAKPVAAARKVPASLEKFAEEFEDEYREYSSPMQEPFFTGDDVWLCLSHRVLCVDLKSGSIKHNIPFSGRVTDFTPGETTLLVVSQKVATNKIVTQVDLASGQAKTAEVASQLRFASAISKEMPTGVLPTAGLLMQYLEEAEEKNRTSIYSWSSEIFPTGQNMVEMQVKLVEPKLETVQTIKPAGPSKLTSDTTASSSARAILEEISNDMKRSAGGGFKRIDISRYEVTLRRSMEDGAVDWTGEVTGLPVFFPQKTVDTLFAGKTLYLFDKQNKKIAEAQLTYQIDDEFIKGYVSGSPCVETNNTLYVFDQGVLTAFELPSAKVLWRLTSVGISGIQFDSKGMLYVSTTTATPEDIQYSAQVKVGDAIQPIILKVDPKSGKTLWKSKQIGGGCFLTGKYLYITDAAQGGFAMIRAVEEAFDAESRGGGSFQVHRMNPSNGKTMWSFAKNGFPENVDFADNRILLHYANEIEIMKFLSF